MPHWVIGGVSGVGKTTIAKALAEELGIPFLDADDFHPPENIRKMEQGIPLTDDDREPWLNRLAQELSRISEAVIACSALKATYRQIIRAQVDNVTFVMLTADRDLLEERMAERDHFMPGSLLESQLSDLELSGDIRVVENAGPVQAVVDKILSDT